MANKYSAFGTQLQRGNGDGPPETFALVPSLKTVSGPTGGESEEIDVTTHDSVAGARELRATFKGSREFTFGIEYDPNDVTHKALIADYDAGTVINWQVILPTTPPATIAFGAFVRNFQIPDLSIDASVRADLTLRLSGAITWPA